MALAQALVVPAVMSESTYSLDIENLHISYDNPTDESLGNDSVDWNRLKAYAASLPYSIESNSTMQNLLDMYLMRIVQVHVYVLLYFYLLPINKYYSVSRPRILNLGYCSGTV